MITQLLSNSRYSPTYSYRTFDDSSCPYCGGVGHANQLSYTRALARERKKVYEEVGVPLRVVVHPLLRDSVGLCTLNKNAALAQKTCYIV